MLQTTRPRPVSRLGFPFIFHTPHLISLSWPWPRVLSIAKKIISLCSQRDPRQRTWKAVFLLSLQGDEILSVNGDSLQGSSHAEAIGVFRRIKTGLVVLHVIRRFSSAKKRYVYALGTSSPHTPLKHIKRSRSWWGRNPLPYSSFLQHHP
jgi:hypothetical protein